MTPRTTTLLGQDHEVGPPYPGARPHYILSERIIQDRDLFPRLLQACAQDVPAKKKKV
jgi:hypothetical protein